MNTSLANLTDNLSEINTMNWKTCKERNRIISTCQYIAYEENHAIYKCEKCNAKSHRPIDVLKESFKTHTIFVTVTLTSFYCY